ncbi:RDD family protein [Marinobacter hydrocarbonoclasticus]|nr:RDD family protein [Marinobacter nauticus]
MEQQEMAYGGFWIRVGAALIDTLLLALIITPILTAIYGQDYWLTERFLYGPWDLLLNYIFPAIVVLVFWSYKSATPGKMILKLTIVDAKTGGKPSTGQLVMRYLGYYVSTIPLLLGLIWVGFDKRKQGWHDKLAGTVVVRRQAHTPVEFEQEAP